MTLVVGGGLMLLLPPVAPATGAPLIAVVPALGCAASADKTRDHQFTVDTAGLDAPDSCDDQDDDDDGDDDSSGGSGQAIAASDRTPANHNELSHLVHVDSDTHRLRPLDAHSLRGPPRDDERSTDADDDGDGDDDDPSPEHSAVLPATGNCDARLRKAADFLSPSSSLFGDLSPRAPPLFRFLDNRARSQSSLQRLRMSARSAS